MTASRIRVATPAIDLDGVELLAAFAATVARYLDHPVVDVAWGADGGWRAVHLVVDLDAPFSALLATAEAALRAPSTAVPAFGIAARGLPSGVPPTLLALDASSGAEADGGAYHSEGVHRFVAHLTRLAAARRSEVALGRLPLVSSAERDLLVPPRPEPPGQETLVDLIRRRVEADPDSPAVVASGRSLSFAELWEQSGALASLLPAGRLVGVWSEPSVDLVVALVGVLRSGSAYVALEPGYPSVRLEQVVDLAGVDHVVAGPDLPHPQEQTLASLDVRVVRTGQPAEGPVPAGPAPDDLAYVMFTSGSTGVPKGVMVEHRSVVNMLAHMARDPGLAPGEALLGVTTAAFDLSVPDLFLPLVTGATLVLADSGVRRHPDGLARLLEQHRPSLMQATPSTWRLLLGSGWPGDPGLRAICGGESYDADLGRALQERVASVWNFYGPTETTVWSVSTRLTGLEEDPLPLGGPMRGVACYVLDSRLEPSPPGVPGQLALAGPGLARGYLDRPDLTDAVFVPCPFPGAPSARMYLTGDVVRVAADGRLRFLGRRDHQIKLNGFRIELGEIEAVVTSLGADHAVAVVRQDGGPTRIVCYVTSPAGGPAVDPDDLRTAAARLLPPQSVPSVVVVVDAMPLTPNGKVDRSALPAPPDRSEVPLQGELEEIVAEAYGEQTGLVVRHADVNVLTLGADSLVVSRIAARLTDELGVPVTPVDVLRNPTVRELAQAVLGVMVGSVEVLDDLSSAPAAEGSGTPA